MLIFFSSEIIDEGPIDEIPSGPETEGFFSRRPAPDTCPPKKQENPCPDNKSEQKKVKSKSKSKGKGKSCDCKTDKRDSRRNKKKKIPPSVNPFIIFYLKMFFDNPNRKITEVAREAGKKWCSMSEKEKSDYIKKAKAESAKRQKKSKKRRGKC